MNFAKCNIYFAHVRMAHITAVFLLVTLLYTCAFKYWKGEFVHYFRYSLHLEFFTEFYFLLGMAFPGFTTVQQRWYTGENGLGRGFGTREALAAGLRVHSLCRDQNILSNGPVPYQLYSVDSRRFLIQSTIFRKTVLSPSSTSNRSRLAVVEKRAYRLA